MISAESMEELLEKMNTLKIRVGEEGLLINLGKTHIQVSGINLGLLKKSGLGSCSVFQTGVGSNAIFCGG